MADESFQEKTEAPTPKKQREAQEEGKIAKTPELSAATMLIAAGFLLGPGGSRLGSALDRITRASFAAGPSALADPVATADWFRWVTAEAALGFLPFAGTLAGLGLLVGAGQARGTWTTKPLEPQWGRLSPKSNLQRILGIRSLVELVKAILKLLLVGAVVWVTLSGASDDILALPQSSARSWLLRLHRVPWLRRPDAPTRPRRHTSRAVPPP